MKSIVILKLVYLHLLYFFVGLEEDSFQISKAEHLFALGKYSAAAKAYQRALEGTKSSYVYGWLGYCFLNLQQYEKAAENLELSLQRKVDPAFQSGLAWAYLGLGADEKCRSVVQTIRGRGALSERELAELERIEAQLH